MGPGGKGRHGGLYQNMQLAFEIAKERGYDFMAIMQDDMQLVWPLDAATLALYQSTFAADPEIGLIDYRFTRSGFHGTYDPDIAAYRYPTNYTYSDVGLFHVQRLDQMNWRFDNFNDPFIASEKLMRKQATEMRLAKVTPFTPVAMHIPFPRLIRNKITLPRLSRLFRTLYTYEYMTDADQQLMDARNPDTAPNFRKFLRFANIGRIDQWLLNAKHDSKTF